MVRDILHQSADIQVRRIGDAAASRQVITFDAYHDTLGFERDAFGESYFAGLGITATHVLSHGNDWFQYAEMPAVLALVRGATGQAAYRMAYGSSMGGYAAVRFADALGADAALAFSPQYAPIRRMVPFEHRWKHDWRRIRPIPSLNGVIATRARIVVAYDPTLATDKGHIELIARDAPHVERLRLRCAGHPVGPFLSEAGLLHPLVSGVLDGSFAATPFEQAARDARKRCSTWLDGMAHRQPTWRPRTAVALARRGVAVEPHSAAALNRLGICLRALGSFDAASAAHLQAVALLPAQDYRWAFGQTLLAAARYDEALEIVSVLRKDAPHVARFHYLASLVQAGRGDAAAALADARTARTLAPGELKYSWHAAKLAWQAWTAHWRTALRLGSISAESSC